MSLVINGIPEMQSRIEQLVRDKREAVVMAMSSVVSEMATWIKNNHVELGGWNNKSHALENSISHDTVDEGNTITGVVYSGMSYAVHVEYREGKWVISAAMEEYKKKAMQLIAERASAL